jgi:hypothetical protein
MHFWKLLIALLILAPAAAYAGDDDPETTDETDADESAEAEADDAAPAPAEETTAEIAPAEATVDEPAPETPAEATAIAAEPEPDPEPVAKKPTVEPAPAPTAENISGTFAPDPPDPAPKKNPFANAPPPPLAFDLPGDFRLILDGRIQVRATLFDMDDVESNDPVVYGDPNLREGFSIRRARIGVGGSWRGFLNFKLSGGWDNRYDATEASPAGGLLLHDAWFGLTPVDAFGFQLGQTYVPFGRQALASSAELIVPERSMTATLLSPGREPGLVLRGALGPKEATRVMPTDGFKYAVSITNGGGGFQGDPDPRPRIAGRVSLDLFSSWDDAESGYEQEGFGLSVGGSGYYNWGLEANSFAFAGDFGVRIWRVTLQGELVYAKATPTFDIEGIPELLSERQSLGWYVQASVVIVPDWLEIAGRVEGYDDNRVLDDAGDRIDIWGGVTLPLLDGRLKTQLFYVHRSELDAHQTPNDTLMLQVQARL